MSKKKEHLLLHHIQHHGAPVIEGEQVTFVWAGDEAPFLIGDFNDWGWSDSGPIELSQVEKGLWSTSLNFGKHAYIEYIFTTDHTEEESRLKDPYNRKLVSNGIGQQNNYFYMPEGKATRLRFAAPKGKRGTVTTHRIEESYLFAGGKRDLWLYHPPVAEPVPLIVVYDGRDYLRRGSIVQIVDNLIARKQIRPVALAMIENAGKVRMIEYSAGELVLIQLLEHVLPLAKMQLNLLDVESHPGAYGVLGASMGGLMATYTGLRLPHIFGHVLSQSGAFHGESRVQNTGLIDLLAQHEPKPKLKIWQDAGLYEWLLESNRQMHSVLTKAGYDVTYREFEGGHNYTCWRNVLPDALMATFGIKKGRA